MKKHILFPVDFQPTHIHLADYAHLFSNIDNKSFSGFFLKDFVKHPKNKVVNTSDSDKSVLQSTLEKEAKALNMDVSFIRSQANGNSLLNQSRFADLALITPITHSNIGILIESFPEDFFAEVGCPIFLSDDLLHPYEEILVLFDYDQSGLAALKSFLSFFGKESSNKKVTILTVSPDDAPEIHLEKYLVSYLQKIFTNVGIVPMGSKDLANQLVNYAAKLNKPVLVMGRAALNLLNNNELASQVAEHHMSIYYSNN